MMLAESQLARPDKIVLVGYFLLMLGIGAYFYRHMRGMKDYFSGGNRIPWWLSGVSFYMSSFSVATFVQYSALAYKYGWVSVTLYWVTVPATLISVVLLASRWRRARINSPVEYLEERYGAAARQVFAWQGIPVTLIDDALKLVAIGGLFIAPLLGWSVRESVMIVGLIMLSYTFLGGLWAVVVTDFVQFAVMTAAVIVLVPLSLGRVGGWDAFVDHAPEGFFDVVHPEYDWIYIGANIVLFTLALSTRWALVQRYYCVPKERDAIKVGVTVVVLNVIGPPLMFLPAMAARQFLGGLEDKSVYAELCMALLPAGMLGLVMAAMFSATMSMLSSDYNVCASVLTNDVYRRILRPDASPRQLVWMGRLMTLLVGLIALGVALAIGDVGGEGLFRSMVKLFSVATAPVAIPMIAGLLSRRVTHAGALGGFLGGIVVGIIVFFVCPDAVAWRGMMLKKETVILFSTIPSTLAATWLAVRMGRPGASEQARAESFLRRLDVPIGRLEQDGAAADGQGGIPPFGVVGVSLLLIGALMLAILPDVQEGPAHTINAWIGAALVAVGGVMVLGGWWAGKAKERST